MNTDVKSTFLSRRPLPRAGLYASLGLAFMAFLTLLSWESAQWRDLLSANGQNVLANQEYWRAITAIFVHSDFAHFLSNAYMFGALAFLVSGYFGLPILVFHVFVLGALIHVLSIWTYPPETYLVGISGVVYELAGFWLVLFVGIETRYSLATRLMRAIGVALIILFPTTFEVRTSYRAHFIGLLIGVIFGLGYFWWNKKFFKAFEIKEVPPPDEFPPHLWN